MGLTVFDENGEYVSFSNYNTYSSLTETDAMVTFINGLPANYLVLVGIKEEGSYELHPDAYAAL